MANDLNQERLGVVALCGDEGTGKTTMALTWPRPIHHMDIDVGGFERAAWRLNQSGLNTESFARPIQESALLGNITEKKSGRITDVRVAKRVEGMKELWEEIIKSYVRALKDKEIATIVIDSATMLWQIAHSAHLQELQDKQIAQGKAGKDWADLRERLTSMEYGPANDRMRQLFHSARGTSTNLVLVHYPRPEYRDIEDTKTGEVKSVQTGKQVMDGFKETAKHSDIVLWLHLKEIKGEMEKGKRAPSTYQPVATVRDKCGLPGMGMNALGSTLKGNFKSLITLRNMMRRMAAAEEE